MTAPLQVIALGFSRGAGSEDRILAEVDRLRGPGSSSPARHAFRRQKPTEPSNG